MQYPRMSPRKRVAALAGSLELDLARSIRYPAWYLRHCHFLPGGYLSGGAGHFYQALVARLYDLPAPSGIRRRIAARTADLRPRRILELGCGTGGLLKELARRNGDATIDGVDLSPFLLDHAREVAVEHDRRIQLHHADASEFAPAEQYDTVVAAHLFGHVPRSHGQAIFANVVDRLLAPGGVLHVIEHRWHIPRWERSVRPRSSAPLTPLLVHRQYSNAIR